MNKKRGLGKGLGDLGLKELLNDMDTSISTTSIADQLPVFSPISKDGNMYNLPIEKIHPGRYQPRKTMPQEALQELANSIRAQGIIQPIIVRSSDQGYEIIAGERRWRAAQLVGLENIPAIVRDIPAEAAMAMALIENIQRRDLNPIEEAIALQRLLDEFQMTHQEVAEAIGKSRTMVTNLIRLLKLNPEVRALVEQGHLEMGHARALLSLEGQKQNKVANQIIAYALSVRETERFIRRLQEGTNENNNNDLKQISVDPDIVNLQKEISDRLNAKVIIKHSTTGKGKLIICYNTMEEIEGILERLR